MIVGIDLGTTNSAAAIWRDGAAELIPNRLGHLLTPSAVSLDQDGTIICGLAARERQITHPRDSVAAFKRYMGSNKITTLGRKKFRPEELSAIVLRSLKEDAEQYLGKTVTEAVITVPAYFNDKQRKATRRAGELAGLTVERLINEPTAAALAYGIHQRDEESRFLVFDLGGGTFDVSVLEIFEGIIEVRASTGDNQLGGEDFNTVLMEMLGGKFAEEWAPWRNDPALHQHIRDQAERARRALSSADRATMNVIWKDNSYSLEVSADEFERQAEQLLERLREPVRRSLRDSNIKRDELSEIVLIGGATRMPMVRRSVARMFGRFPNATVDPDHAVALGAAIQAGLKGRDAALREVVLTDVCPYSLGVETSAARPNGVSEPGHFTPIIERNTVIPASRVQCFSTTERNQRLVKVRVFQGEARMVQDNILLGEVEIPVPPGPAGQPVEIRFSYDINGLLEADIHIPQTGDRYEFIVVEPDSGADEATMEARRQKLAQLKVHPRDTEPVRAVLARGARIWEQSLGEQRQMVGAWIEQFEIVVQNQDPRAVEHARAQLTQALDSIEGESFL